MKSYRIIALALALYAFASCADRASVSGVLNGAPESDIEVRQLNVNRYAVLDTIKTGKDGSFSYSVNVAEGQPEFIYLFYGNTRVASLLLESGEKAVVEADTLGNYNVSGSEGSVKLREVEMRYADFMSKFLAADGDRAGMTKLYVDYYRSCLRYVMSNPRSITVIPVLYQNLSEYTPIFNRQEDAIFFRSAADSLKAVYPDSRYVKALDREADRRMKELQFNSALKDAKECSFPDINMPDIKGERKALSSVDAKVVMLHFWSSTDAANKMFNIEKLLPIYQDYHSLGFEIYSVCIDPDKAVWGSVVTAQKLPWINVNDGLGLASPVVSTYNLEGLPVSFLIADGEMLPSTVKSEAELRKELTRLLK